MSENRQGAAFLTFKGGLNTESTDLATNPEDARVLLNTKLTSQASLRRRTGVDIFPTFDADTQFHTEDVTSYTTSAGQFIDPATSGYNWRVVNSYGVSIEIVVVMVGRSIYIYDRTALAVIDTPGAYRQQLYVAGDIDARAALYKTQFVSDSQRLFIINPYIPLMHILYEESTDRFVTHTDDVFARNLDGNIPVDSRVSNGGKIYSCIKTHSSAIPESQPGVGLLWQNYWNLVGELGSASVPAWASGTGNIVSRVLSSTTTKGERLSQDVTTYVVADYTCAATHVSDSSTEPGVGGLWTNYWVLTDVYSFSVIGTGAFQDSGQNRYIRHAIWQVGQTYNPYVAGYTSNVVKLTWTTNTGFPAGFSAGCFSSGRLWLCGTPTDKNTIFFSQSVVDTRHYWRMYQEADPMSSIDSDLVESDGGYIRLKAAADVVGLVDFRGGVLVLATNGIWFISGSNGYFTPISYSVQKLSDEGCLGRDAWTYMDNMVVYAGASGISAINVDEISGVPAVQEISGKIKSLWTNIPKFLREACSIMYNKDTFQLVVSVNIQEPEWWVARNPYNQPTRFTDFLIFDTRLAAWYQYEVARDSTGLGLGIGPFFPVLTTVGSLSTVTTTTGETVFDEASDVVFSANATAIERSMQAVGVFIVQNGANLNFTLGLLEGAGQQDFSQSATYATSYDSTIRTAPLFFSDLGHRKQVPYLHTVFETVETGFDTITNTYTNPGGCNYRVLWNWAENDDAVKYGDSYKAYKPTRYNLSYYNGTLTGYSSVRNKHRIRGSGIAVAFQFENDGDKDFHLLGWQLDLFANKQV